MNAMAVNMNLPVSVSEEDMRTLLAVKLFEVGKVSLGQAAKIANFSKKAFIDVLGIIGFRSAITKLKSCSRRYKVLRPNAKPRFDTINRVCTALGVRLVAEPARSQGAS